MKLFSYGKDGGLESHVWGFWLIEIKWLFSIAVLIFEDGSRDAYHSHAFNSVSWLLSGKLWENFRDGSGIEYTPSYWPIITTRDTTHLVESDGRSVVLTFRGPWSDTWHEYVDEHHVVLGHGRRVVG